MSILPTPTPLTIMPAGPASSVVKPDEDDDALVVAGSNEPSAGSTKSSSSEQQQVDVGQDKSSRERGSLLVRLRHISADNLGAGYEYGGKQQDRRRSIFIISY